VKRLSENKIKLTSIPVTRCQADLNNLYSQFVVKVTNPEHLGPKSLTGCKWTQVYNVSTQNITISIVAISHSISLHYMPQDSFHLMLRNYKNNTTDLGCSC